VKTFGTVFGKFYYKGSFCKKQKLLEKFSGFATSGRHNSAMITNAENSRLSGPSMGCLFSIFKVGINSKSSTGLYAAHRKRTSHLKLFCYCHNCVWYRSITRTSVTHTQPISIDYWVTWHRASWNAVSKTAYFTWMLKQNSSNKNFCRHSCWLKFCFTFISVKFHLNCNRLQPYVQEDVEWQVGWTVWAFAFRVSDPGSNPTSAALFLVSIFYLYI